MIDDVMDETYDVFGIDATVGGDNIRVVKDTGIEADDRLLPTFKTKASWMPTYKDDRGITQLVNDTITIDGETLKVISWEFFGNKREEIIFAVEGDYRGR